MIVHIVQTEKIVQGSYLKGIRHQLGGLTEKVKSWYCGRHLVSFNIDF